MPEHRKRSRFLAAGALGTVVLGTGLLPSAHAQPVPSSTRPPVSVPFEVTTGEPPFDFVQFPTPPDAVLTVEPVTVVAGSTVTVTGTLCGQSPVVVIGNQPSGPFVTAADNGLAHPEWRIRLTIPPSFPVGSHQVLAGCRLAYGADVGFLYKPTTVQVTAAPTPPTTPPTTAPPQPDPAPPVPVRVRPRFTG